MAGSTTNLDTISATQAGKETTANELFDALSPASLFGRRASTTGGLTWGYYGGPLFIDGVFYTIANGTLALTASSTNYVETTRDGVVSKNTTGFSAGSIPLYTIVVGTATVTSYTDNRSWATLVGVVSRLSKSVAGASNVTLTAAEARAQALNFTGILTGSINVIVPNGPQQWTVSNNTTGAFTLTVKTVSGTGVAVTQGLNALLLADGTNVIASTNSGSGLTSFSEVLNVATPNATIPVASLQSTNAATNIDTALLPKGTGALLGAVPNNSTTGGNKRGSYAVDWQTAGRSNADKVASGSYAVIAGGQHNKASNNFSTIGGGSTNTATGDNSGVFCGSDNTASANNSYVFAGRNNTANATDTFVGGGYLNTCNGQYGSVIGGRENSVTHIAATATGWGAKSLNDGGMYLANGSFAAGGDAQLASAVIRCSTTNATATALTTNASAQATGNQFTLENSSSAVVKGLVVARQNTTGDTKSWEFTAHIRRGANAAATAMVATCTPTVVANDAGASTWTLTVTADTTRGALEVIFTGEAAKTIRSVGYLSASYVSG